MYLERVHLFLDLNLKFAVSFSKKQFEESAAFFKTMKALLSLRILECQHQNKRKESTESYKTMVKAKVYAKQVGFSIGKWKTNGHKWNNDQVSCIMNSRISQKVKKKKEFKSNK